jgi:transposase
MDMWRARYPHSGTIFIFRSKRADRLKIVTWDGSGLLLLWKRLEHGAFRWPPISDGVMRLTTSQLAALVDGMDWERRETGERQRVACDMKMRKRIVLYER